MVYVALLYISYCSFFLINAQATVITAILREDIALQAKEDIALLAWENIVLIILNPFLDLK